MKLEELAKLLLKHRIKFEGSATERKWPDSCCHLFSVISEISGNRYNEFMETRDDVPREIRTRQRLKVKRLRDRVKMLRKDAAVNEATWRDQVEKLVVDVLDEGVICDCCGNERWFSPYQATAHPLKVDENDKLKRKRARRRMCNCDSTNDPTARRLDDSYDSDDEDHSMVFKSTIDSPISHNPEDHLRSLKIPMKPDRVVGLRMTPRYSHLIKSSPVELQHSPYDGIQQLLYPFLIIEAKQDKSPGFRSIEAQTAFPLRRVLRLQHKLRTAQGRVDLDPLVWFFAYQAEQWRLYAATMTNLEDVVFQLWHGAIEFQDHALQLLQIVDFIWTWARDVYRPNIRECLRVFDHTQRDTSQASTNRFTRSQSAASNSIILSSLGGYTDRVMDEWTGSRAPFDPNSPPFPETAGSHPFLRWKTHHYNMAPWAAQTSIQHADIFAASFRVLEIPSDAEDLQKFLISLEEGGVDRTTLLGLLDSMRQKEYSTFVHQGSISGPNFGWTNSDAPETPATDSQQLVKVFIFFRTYCHTESWQIRREFFCIMWSSAAEGLLSSSSQPAVYVHSPADSYPKVIRAIRQLLDLSGKWSVESALSSATLILANHDSLDSDVQLHWERPSEHMKRKDYSGQYVSLFDTIALGNTLLQSYHRQHMTVVTTLGDAYLGAPPVCVTEPLEDLDTHDAMLAVKPQSWPAQCPHFCLFVFLRYEFDEKAVLRKLLRHSVKSQKVRFSKRQIEEAKAATAALGVSEEEGRVLQDWDRALKYMV